jgi:hypothetical protein
MKVTELIWERIGFGLVGAIAGAIYGLAVSFVIVLLLKKMALGFMLKVFCSVFGIAGVLLGKSIVGIVIFSVYPLYLLWGVFLGLIGESGFIISEDSMPKKGAALYIVLLGAISVLASFLLW